MDQLCFTVYKKNTHTDFFIKISDILSFTPYREIFCVFNTFMKYKKLGNFLFVQSLMNLRFSKK